MTPEIQSSVDWFLSIGFSGGGWILAALSLMTIRTLLQKIESMHNERVEDAERRAEMAELAARGVRAGNYDRDSGIVTRPVTPEGFEEARRRRAAETE